MPPTLPAFSPKLTLVSASCMALSAEPRLVCTPVAKSVLGIVIPLRVKLVAVIAPVMARLVPSNASELFPALPILNL